MFNREKKPNIETAIARTIREENGIRVTYGLANGANINNSAFIIQNKWSNSTSSQTKEAKGIKENYWCDYLITCNLHAKT